MRWASVLAALPAASAVLAAPPVDTIRWVAQDVPPHFSFVQGRPPGSVAELGRGEVDGFMRVLLPRMPGYRHEFVEASTARYETESRRGRTLCSTLHVRTPERLQWLYFSHLYPPLASREIHVIVPRKLMAELAAGRPQDGRLALARLLERQDLRPLVARDRAFGVQIDSLLSRHAVPRLAVGAKFSHQLMDMLRAGRMDYTLEYPALVQDYLARVGDPGALVALPMAEGLSTLLATVSCSRTPEGLRQIKAIDAAVRELASDPDREAWVREWRGGRAEPQDQKRLNAYMDERARGGARIE
ncbi:TIGR02285 family protein [Roseateles sp.]|uniref:TIGR02285 family protein n=1 Tax=Roseateles sp. TaxID=1971397 RepID=UPI0025CE7E6D|nr:TIGR02285 family protein [Roseateles sp.]MBV8035500.1 TIGR02285 family protein [Roseateles sp.]